MKPQYAHFYSLRHSRMRYLSILTEDDIRAEYDELSARRNSRLDESERTATPAEVIDWLENAVDDGALRRYVPIETARVEGIRAVGYGREFRYDAADVRDLLLEIEHGECADCGVHGPIVDTPDGHIIRDGGLDLRRSALDDGEVYLCGSTYAPGFGDPVCDACKGLRAAKARDPQHDVEACFDSGCPCKFRASTDEAQS